ncbi:MAG: AAA family ATPase [Cyanobacteria bacterium SBLK]|nr:AAA family ATPase [Cyanobacteria bacterium SBLK]
MTQLFNNLKIQGFRGFQEIELSDLGQVNLIVGTNNSGKTSLLEAISIFCNPLNPFRWLEVSQRRFLFNRRPIYLRPNIESLKWIFYKQEHLQEEDYRKILVQANGNLPIRKLEAEFLEIYGSLQKDKIDDEESENYREGLELKIKAQETFYLLNYDGYDVTSEEFQFWEDERFVYKKPHESFIKNATISPSYSYSEPVGFTRSILKDKKSKKEILDLIRLFDPYIEDIMILSPKRQSVLYLGHEKLGLIPLDVFGDGIKRTLSIVLALQAATDGVLLIDEIETSIHVSALTPVFSWLVESCLEKNVQLFITTHSLEAVDAMIQSKISQDRIVAFQFNDVNESIKRFSGDILNRLRLKRGLDIR